MTVPSVAAAHAVMTTPPPRDVGVAGSDGHKTGPCGGVARAGAPTKYAIGATFTVSWQETVPHTGCFQVGFSPKDDANFTVLKQLNDPDNAAVPAQYSTSVTLPAGVSCPDCTLVVRQLMDGQPCKTPAVDPATVSTYYSCADICVGDTCSDGGTPPADAGPTDGGVTPGTDSGVSTSPTDGGGKFVDGGEGSSGNGGRPDLRAGEGDGCAVSPGGTSSTTFGICAGLLGLALLGRRKKR